MSTSQKSYSQQKRDKLNYRAEYFKHNPGIMGCIWICAYCKKPLLGKQNVQVDHIMPLNNPLGRNARYNLVAACAKCNHEKSDKVDRRVLTGYTSKGLEVVYYSIQKAVIITLVAIGLAAQKTCSFVLEMLKKPFYHSSTMTKLLALCAYAFLLFLLYQKFSSGF